MLQKPTFIPVGTQATVKSLTPQELEALGVEIFFANTYHLYLHPGDKIIKNLGGLHKFTAWKGKIITDSGGFQVFSLGKKQGTAGKLIKIREDGVHFRSHRDGSPHFINPQKSIEIQHNLGADYIIAFDYCTPYPASRHLTQRSLDLTHRWAQESLTTHQKLSLSNPQPPSLYGVIQGGYFKDLRQNSADFITSLDFAAFAIGGISVGEPKEKMREAVSWVLPTILKSKKPVHLLGVGEPDDIFDFFEAGITSMDCTLPTRLGRAGHFLFKSNNPQHDLKKHFRQDINQSRFQKDKKPLLENCSCYTCQNFSRAYLHHLFKGKELLSYRLLTLHNLHFILSLVREIRQTLNTPAFPRLKKSWLGRL